MNIPAIGTARGVFEMFVPGVFVILNVFAVLYSVLDSTAQEQVRELAAGPVLGLVVLICLGYLVGAILRLLGTEMPDNWSARWNRLRNKDARAGDTAKPTCRERWSACRKRLLYLLKWIGKGDAESEGSEAKRSQPVNGGQPNAADSNGDAGSDDTAKAPAENSDQPGGTGSREDVRPDGPAKAKLTRWNRLRTQWLTWWDPKAVRQEARFKPWAVEDFPYIEWIGLTHTSRHKTDSVHKFYEEVWETVTGKNETGSELEAERWREKTFLNHCKTLINSLDDRAAQEIYSAEALVRYLTGMFYALIIALVLMAIGIASQLVLAPSDKNWWPFLILLGAYLLMLLAIIRHYRIMRIKEVEIVFSATYRHRELFPTADGPSSFPHRRKRSSRPTCHPYWR